MKIDIPKDWCERMAKLDGDGEIGAGLLARDPVFSTEEGGTMKTLDNRIAEVIGYTAPEDIAWKLRLLINDQTAAMRAALARIERTTKGYDEYSQMGAVHIIARDALKTAS